MKRTVSFLFLLTVLLATATFSCKKDENEKEKDLCNTFFTENAMKVNFVATSITTNFTSEFTKDKAYEVTISSNGNISVASNSSTYSFTKEMIVECKIGTSTNVDYVNPDTNLSLFLKKETSSGGESFSVRLYNPTLVQQATVVYEVK